MKVISHMQLILVCLVVVSYGRKHQLELEDDPRRLIHVTTFGFYKGGFLDVQLNNFVVKPPVASDGKMPMVGFTVDRTLSDGINPYPHSYNIDTVCEWRKRSLEDEGISSITFTFDFQRKWVSVVCSPVLQTNVKVYRNSSQIPLYRGNYWISDMRGVINQRRRRDAEKPEDNKPVSANPVAAGAPINDNNRNPPVPPGVSSSSSSSPGIPSGIPGVLIQKDRVDASKQQTGPKKDNPLPVSSEENMKDPDAQIPFKDPADVPNPLSNVGSCGEQYLPLNATVLSDGSLSYSTNFVVYIAGEDCEGLYNLYFHNCAENDDSRVYLNLSVIEENQHKNYLSAGEMPLPALYFMMSILFFISGCFWVFILRKSKRETGVAVYKIHYLMGALVYVKSLSLFFHAINYHYIQIEGTHVEGWAVLYYIAHLLKGALLFITILLIGTGYAFVKHLLSDKDKKIFMIVIPLQVLANVAEIINEESEEGQIIHTTWRLIFISVDLLCCGAILFPVVWSIRHLQEASQTDGKAATNLRKLKLFRHFYIIVVCYIYFTRIIVNMLLRITVPFQYEWLDEMFREMTTFIFFVLTGYKFRPAPNNPYLSLAHDSDDETEMDISVTESGLTAGLSKRGVKPKKKTLKEIVLFDPNEEETDDDEEVLLEKRRESSHDFD